MEPMAKAPTPAPEASEQEAVGIATVLGREIKMKRLTPDQLLAADMMARRLKRIADAQQDKADPDTEEWRKFLTGTQRLLDWISGQFYSQDDLEWFEDRMLAKELTLGDIAPLMEAMGMPTEQPAPVNRRARRAK